MYTYIFPYSFFFNADIHYVEIYALANGEIHLLYNICMFTQQIRNIFEGQLRHTN